MTKQEMNEICKRLMGAYRFMDFSDEQTFSIWYEQLKKYEAGEVRQAVNNWVAFSSKEPTPADILDATKNVRIANRTIAQESVSWNEAVRCPKCNDRGFVMIRYPSDYEEMRVCSCSAAHNLFGGMFTEQFVQRAEAIAENEKPYGDGWWKDMRYKFDIRVNDQNDEKRIREEWTKKRFTEVKAATRSGLIEYRVEEIRR